MGICFPDEWSCFLGVVFCEESVDCGLQVDEGMEDTVLEAASGQLDEKALNRIQP